MPGKRLQFDDEIWQAIEAVARGRQGEAAVQMTDDEKTACCNQYNQPLIEIDNRGQRLTGCLTCNLWAPDDGKRWTRLSVEDLRALHHLRHGGRSRKRAPD